MHQANLLALLQVIAEPSVEANDIKHVAAIYLKNAIKRQWYPGGQNTLDASLKPALMSQLLHLVPGSPPTVQDQLLECLRVAIQEHTPPEVINQVIGGLGDSGNSVSTLAALKVMRIVARKYEYRDGDDLVELDAIVAAVFPSLTRVYSTLLAGVAESIQTNSSDISSLHPLRLCLKIYYSCTYMDMPKSLDARPWMEGMLMLAGLHAGPVASTRDVGHPWWKLKKWLHNSLARFFTKYASKKKASASGSAAPLVGLMDPSEVCMKILHATIHSLSLFSQGHFLSPRVANALLNLLDEAVRRPPYWNEIQPHIGQLIQHVVIPMLAFDDLDQELWDEDPEEYIRKGYDIIEDIYSPKTSAVGVLCGLCASKKKNQLDPVMGFLASTFQEAAMVDTAAMTQAQARKLDGAIFGVGSLAETLRRSERYKSQIPSLFQTYILPIFASPYGHVRSKACWISSEFADVIHELSPDLFMQLFLSIQVLMNDAELPVKVDAAVALRLFFEEVDEQQVERCNFLGALPGLLKEFLELANQVDSEEIMATIETIVDKFGDHIGPYAHDVASALVAQFWKIVNTEQVDDEDVFSDALAGHQVLATIATVLEAVSKSPEILAQMELLLFPIFDKFLGDHGMDIIEEMLELMTQLTYYAPAISERMWSLYPRILDVMPTWGVDFFQEFIPVVDNFISRGTSVFVQHYLAGTNAMLEKALVRFQGEGEDDGFGTDEEVFIGVAEIIQVILEHCKGMVDPCIKPYMSMVVGTMSRNDQPDGAFEDPHVLESLLVAGADALYYNSVLTMNSLQETGQLAYFMQSLGQAVSKRKKRSGKLYHFGSKRQKKTILLGLAAVLATPGDAMQPGMRQSIPQIAAAAVALLMDLKKQEVSRPGTGGSAMTGASGSSTDFDSRYLDDSGDDEEDDSDDEDVFGQLRHMQGRSAGGDEDDEEDLMDRIFFQDDDESTTSPLDDVCVDTAFKEACTRLRVGDEHGFMTAVGLLNDEQKAWLEQFLTVSG